MEIPLAPTSKSIYDYGFDRGLSRPIDDNSTGVVYDSVGNSQNTASLLSGGNLTLRTLNVGGFSRQVAPGDDIQQAINAVSQAGGGVVQLATGQYNVTQNINIPSRVALQGQVGTVIDFGGGPYQLRVVGSNGYSTSTLSITNDSTSPVGFFGTNWTSAMIGRNILIGDFWYTIASASGSAMTLTSPYIGVSVLNASYVIANTIDGAAIQDVTLQNSSIATLKVQYANGIDINGVTCLSGLAGIDFDDSAFLNVFNVTTDVCGTGITMDNCHFGTVFNTNITNSTSGGGFIANKLTNTGLEIFCIQNCTGDALSLTNADNNGIEDFSIQETTGIGIKLTTCTVIGISDGLVINSSSDNIQMTSVSRSEVAGVQLKGAGSNGIQLVSGNSDISLNGFTITTSASDGIKLTATSDSVIMSGLQIHGNSGYGVDIAASTCDNNVVVGNYFASNTSGHINDSGTGTVIGDNSPTSINTGGTAGTYTPTLTNVANLDGSSVGDFQYMRVGSSVSVSGGVNINPTTTATSTKLGISLPIASNFTNTDDCAGTGYTPTIAAQGAAVLADTGNDRAQVQWLAGDVTSQSMFISFMYTVK